MEPAPSHEADRAVAQPSAWRFVAVALAFLLLAAVGSVVGGFIAGFVTAFVRAFVGLPVTRTVTDIVLSSYMGIFGFEIVLLLAAVLRGRVIGKGDARAGLADNPISELPLCAALFAVTVAYAIVANLFFNLAQLGSNLNLFKLSPLLYFFAVFLVVVLAPLSEELFFRGWLWTGLRLRWSVLPTAAMTSALWVLLHIERGVTAMIVLIPVAVILSAARHYGQSVRASVLVHLILNAIGVIFPWLRMPAA
jgi:membrane protease YdiL (CAAX protease family)